MRTAVCLVLLVACIDPTTASSRQGVESDCKLLPPAQSYDEWHDTPLFPSTATRAVTLTYDLGDAKFVAYGVDVDAKTVAFVMVGRRHERDTFVARLESITHDSGVASTIAGKVGGGGGPRPPGDPDAVSPAFLTETASRLADVAFGEPRRCAD